MFVIGQKLLNIYLKVFDQYIFNEKEFDHVRSVELSAMVNIEFFYVLEVNNIDLCSLLIKNFLFIFNEKEFDNVRSIELSLVDSIEVFCILIVNIITGLHNIIFLFVEHIKNFC